MDQEPPSFDSLLDTALSGAMSQLQHLNQDEMKTYLVDDTKIDALIDNLPQVRSMPTEREMGLAHNKSLAEWNLSQEPKLNEAKQRLRATYDGALQLKQEVEGLKQRLETVSKERSLDTTLALLQAAAQGAEDDSESTAEKFLDGQLDADQFLAEFHQKRCLAHMRKVKVEKMTEILGSQQYGAPQSSAAYNRRAPPPPPTANKWAYPNLSQAPYPS
uniref:VPS37 C-terminal domain-containing protein n=1 Tax=Plectus sambesii TaxID=2011161 RepID=A0A914WGP6_9BILA